MPKIIYGLKLTGEVKSLFECLVLVEEPDLRTGRQNENTLKQKVDALRLRMQEKQSRKSTYALSASRKLFATKNIFPVYAARGTLERGASLGEICFRTKLSFEQASASLKILISEGCVRTDGRRFYVTNIHLDIEALGENSGFRQIYKASLKEMAECIDKKRNDPECLFFHSAFSVNTAKLADLKIKLEQILFDLITENQHDIGDTVQKITLGFYR